MRNTLGVLCFLLLAGCSSAPPDDVKGQWVGWCEPAMDTKTGITLELSQNGKELTGTYTAQQVSNLGGNEQEKGTLTGSVSGTELTVTFSETFQDIDTEPVSLALTEENGQKVLAGILMHEGGVGTKYRFEKKK